MNKAQEVYLYAKAWALTTKSMLDEAEEEYIKSHNITNSDGSVPKHLFGWDADDETADKATIDFYSDSDVKELDKLNSEAKVLLIQAENVLIEFGISIAPENTRDALRIGAKHWKYRKQILDIALSVDVSTIPEEIRRATE